MDKRLSTGRLVTDRLIKKSLKGAVVAGAVFWGLGYAWHFIEERDRAEESAIEAKIAVAKRVLADTAGEPSVGGGSSCQRLHSVLDGAQAIVAEVNRFSENVIADKCSEAEGRFERILPAAKNEASTMLGRLRQLKVDYASSMVELNRRFVVVVGRANDAIQKRASLERKLNQYRTGLQGVIDRRERGSPSENGKRLLECLGFMNVRGMKASAVIAKACSEVEDSWTAISDTDKVVADMIGQVEAAKRDVSPKVAKLKTFVASAENLHTRFMRLPTVEKWEHSADWYRAQCRSIDGGVRRYISGPYFYDRFLADDVLDKVSELKKKVADEDAPEPVALYRDVQVRYNEFVGKCTWRQGVKHPDAAHVVSSSTPNQWIAESGWEFVYPGTSNLMVRRKAPTWACPKEWYERECSVVENNVRFYTSGGYRYPRGGDDVVVRQVQNLRRCLFANDPEGSAREYSELKTAYDTFVRQCQWTSGLRHPRFPHVVSGTTANQWVAENGWEFVNPGTSDFTVRQKRVQVRCDACRGSGYVVQTTRCYSCNGRGRVPNQAAQVGQAINAFGDLIGAISHGRKDTRRLRIPQGPSEIRCSSCNGTGDRQQNVRCSKCMGRGMIY